MSWWRRLAKSFNTVSGSASLASGSSGHCDAGEARLEMPALASCDASGYDAVVREVASDDVSRRLGKDNAAETTLQDMVAPARTATTDLQSIADPTTLTLKQPSIAEQIDGDASDRQELRCRVSETNAKEDVVNSVGECSLVSRQIDSSMVALVDSGDAELSTEPKLTDGVEARHTSLENSCAPQQEPSPTVAVTQSSTMCSVAAEEQPRSNALKVMEPLESAVEREDVHREASRKRKEAVVRGQCTSQVGLPSSSVVVVDDSGAECSQPHIHRDVVDLSESASELHQSAQLGMSEGKNGQTSLPVRTNLAKFSRSSDEQALSVEDAGPTKVSVEGPIIALSEAQRTLLRERLRCGGLVGCQPSAVVCAFSSVTSERAKEPAPLEATSARKLAFASLLRQKRKELLTAKLAQRARQLEALRVRAAPALEAERALKDYTRPQSVAADPAAQPRTLPVSTWRSVSEDKARPQIVAAEPLAAQPRSRSASTSSAMSDDDDSRSPRCEAKALPRQSPSQTRSRSIGSSATNASKASAAAVEESEVEEVDDVLPSRSPTPALAEAVRNMEQDADSESSDHRGEEADLIMVEGEDGLGRAKSLWLQRLVNMERDALKRAKQQEKLERKRAKQAAKVVKAARKAAAAALKADRAEAEARHLMQLVSGAKRPKLRAA